MNQSPLHVHVNGQLVPAHGPAISALDRGLLYGDGLFETVRAYGGTPFLLDEHLDRMAASARALRIAERLDTGLMASGVAELLEANGLARGDADAYIRINLTRGIHAGVLSLEPAAEPTVTVIARPLAPPPRERYERGIACITAAVRRNAESPLPRHKTLNYLEGLIAKTEARDAGADDAILLDTCGRVAEGASSNLFVARHGGLATPPLDAPVLPGITRRLVVRLAAELGIEPAERPIEPDELRDADEIFLTSSIAEIVPVRALDGRLVGDGMPGPLARRLHKAYRDAARAASA
jgi:branched-chain amino acid aminotransferase